MQNLPIDKEVLPYLLLVKKWETPATKYPSMKVGTTEIVRGIYRRNYYAMQGIHGKAFYKAVNPIKITILKINNKIWMVDDPTHWWAMKLLAKRSKGRVLCGGLGLGLIVHALLRNKAVTKIDVAEINPDVIQLVKPLLPKSPILNIEETDVFSKTSENYDTVILDLWMWEDSTKEAMKAYLAMLSAFAHFKVQNPKANVYIWGCPDHAINPTFNIEVRKKYLELMKEPSA